ncbi:MAG: DUF4160 domain-containing protein [Abditibacteriota bacterium]|nr:DUF4160 domain-containing protein [Abditibacteriota bacterium]
MNSSREKEWLTIKFSKDIPHEIISFLESVFLITEIRARMGQANGIIFEIRTREKNHNIPHVHAKYGEFSVTINIETAEVIAGNLPYRQQGTAIDWVKTNKANLLGKWKDIAVTACSHTTKSMLQ